MNETQSHLENSNKCGGNNKLQEIAGLQEAASIYVTHNKCGNRNVHDMGPSQKSFLPCLKWHADIRYFFY